MPYNNGWFVSSVSRFCTRTMLCTTVLTGLMLTLLIHQALSSGFIKDMKNSRCTTTGCLKANNGSQGADLAFFLEGNEGMHCFFFVWPVVFEDNLEYQLFSSVAKK